MMGLVLTWCALLAALGGTLATPVASYDTIVVGLGSAGTTAASTLARAGRRVLALEAQDRVGGRVWTRPVQDGVVEMGAEWIYGLFPSRVYDLAIQNNVSVALQDPPLYVFRSDGAGHDGPLTELFNYCKQVIDEGSDRPEESTGQLVERKLRQYLVEEKPELVNDTELVERLLALMNEMVNTLEASNSFYDVPANGPYENLNGSLFGSWHRYGYRTFFDILLNTYNNGPGLPSLDIKLNKEVTSIQWDGDGVLVGCRDGGQYSAHNVIVTVSLGVLKERHATLFSSPLPPEKVDAIESISMGLLDKVVLVYEETWSLFENIMFYWTAADVALLPPEDQWLTKVAGISQQAGCNNTVTLWLAGDAAKLEESLPEEKVRSMMVELLQRFLGGVDNPLPTTILRSTWFSNPFTRGSYSYDSLATAKRPELRDTLAAPLVVGGVPRVLFAGEATNTKRYGTVHGASDTGYREAQRLLAS